MSFKQRTLLVILAEIIFILSSTVLHAQHYDVNKASNQIMNRFMDQMMTNSLLRNGDQEHQLFNVPYLFRLKMKDSSEKMVFSKLYTDPSGNKTYLLLVDKRFPKSDLDHRLQKFYPNQTLSITREDTTDDTNNTVTVNGVSTDSCWMFKAKKGAINVYSYLSEIDNNFDPFTIAGIQLNNGPIVKFTANNLKPMLEGDSDAMVIFDKGNYYRALKKFNKDAEKAAKK